MNNPKALPTGPARDGETGDSADMPSRLVTEKGRATRLGRKVGEGRHDETHGEH